MRQWGTRLALIALVFLFLGVAGAAAAFALIPDPGSPPGVYDTFNWDSTANGYWHVNPYGATAVVRNSALTLSGHTIELDRRLQTDPFDTVVVIRVRGLSFDKFGFGIGGYHIGGVGMEFDKDGAKCGYGSDFGWEVPFVKGWTVPPSGQWFYLALSVKDPYPNVTSSAATGTKPIGITCAMYDSSGRLVNSITPTQPPANAKYPGFDEVYMRTWDSQNRYQIDWVYAGPPAGSPLKQFRP